MCTLPGPRQVPTSFVEEKQRGIMRRRAGMEGEINDRFSSRTVVMS